jgi:epoxyqueuosine reductase QueG
VVIGLPVHLPVIETTPSIFYHEHYNTLNRLLDQYTYLIAERFNQAGHPSVSLPRDGYGSIGVLRELPVAFFSHRHAAFLAGLGTFGLNNMVLTQMYGPRVRFSSVFTAARLPPDPLMKKDLCTRCYCCVEMCPVEAIPKDPYPQGITRKGACTEYSAALAKRHASPCGVCIKVCPIGEDRRHFGRTDPNIYSRQYLGSPLERAWTHVRKYGLKGESKEL